MHGWGLGLPLDALVICENHMQTPPPFPCELSQIMGPKRFIVGGILC